MAAIILTRLLRKLGVIASYLPHRDSFQDENIGRRQGMAGGLGSSVLTYAISSHVTQPPFLRIHVQTARSPVSVCDRSKNSFALGLQQM